MSNQFAVDILEEALRQEALKFGEFKLKGGRKSPWFFNAALLNGGRAFEAIGRGYARMIGENWDGGKGVDVIFGPAYKGIPLATLASLGLYDIFGIDKPIAYNRKEAKDHGEGGYLVGAPLAGKRVLIVDDVMTEGTAANESVKIIREHGGTSVGMAIILDRQEKGKDATKLSAVQQVAQTHGFSVRSILTFADIYQYAAEDQSPEIIQALNAYRMQYGVD